MLTNVITFLNQLADATLGLLLEPIRWLPGAVSIAIIGAITGLLMLVAFKYTSNQSAIKHTRDQIKANLLGLSLFKDDLRVGFGMQGRLLMWAARLLALSIVPMLVMIVPTCLILSQLALWFQARPLEKGETAIVTLRISDGSNILDELQLLDSPSFKITKGPVRVPAKGMICWEIEAHESGLQELVFDVKEDRVSKELAIGSSLMPVSLMKPGPVWTDALLHPEEAPFSADSPVVSIDIGYPERLSWTHGTHTWLFSWFAVSILAALVAKPLLNVNI